LDLREALVRKLFYAINNLTRILDMGKIRVFGIGHGTVLSSLIKAVELFKNKKLEGLWHDKIGGYGVEDIEVIGLSDINCEKIRDNRFYAIPGLLLDDIAILRDYLGSLCTSDPESFKRELRKTEPDIVLLAINSGEERTSRKYAEISMELNISFINTTPEIIARDQKLFNGFIERDIILVGDDLLSSIGGTMIHKSVAEFFSRRNLRILRSYQLDISGTLETLVTSDENIRMKKREVKSRSIGIEGVEKITAGTTDYVPFLEDQRISHIYMEILGPLNKIYRIEIKYWSYDGSSSVNTVLDTIRAIAYSVREYGGDKELLRKYAEIISAYGFKAPPRLIKYSEALELFEKIFVRRGVVA
jgi:myo-inositol-1-phosphate synthase